MSLSTPDKTLRLLTKTAQRAAPFDGDRVRRLRDTGGHLDRARWSELAELGWLGIMCPAELGGAALTLEAVTILTRHLGYVASPEPFVAAGVLAPAVLAESDVPSAISLLERVIAGESIAAVAWQQESGGIDPDDIGATVQATADTDVITGDLRYIGVPDVETFIVAARGHIGVSLHLIDANAAGVSVKQDLQADGMLSPRLLLDGVTIPATSRILGGDTAGAAFAKAVEIARVAVAAELVGLMDRVLELTVDYLKERKQFGKPIGAQQALQHRVCDLWIQRELSSAALDAAVASFAGSEPDTLQVLAIAASSVKSRASQSAALIVREALQLHGAIGFTDEYDLGLYLNRALALAPWLGGPAAHRSRYARLTDISAGRRPHA
jgi:alkylation response protein AidB-like acyl-CoA dehydrogenase